MRRIGTDEGQGGGRVRRYRGLLAVIGVLTAIALGVGEAGLYLFGPGLVHSAANSQAPVESELFGAWCSSRGDRLDLTDGRFSIDPMSPTLAGQIGFFIPTPDPSRPHHWDDPPATSAAGRWYLDVLGADLLSEQIVSTDLFTGQLNGEIVVSDELDLSVDRTGADWQLYLELEPAGTGEMTFVRCANAESN